MGSLKGHRVSYCNLIKMPKHDRTKITLYTTAISLPIPFIFYSLCQLIVQALNCMIVISSGIYFLSVLIIICISFQLPRLYNIYKEMGIVNSFQNMLDNVFLPLFEVTVDPNSHPQLHVFLEQVGFVFCFEASHIIILCSVFLLRIWIVFSMQVVGFDLVDDESKPERRPTKHMPTPDDWNIIFNPAYSYYAYYVYANLYTLNKV